MPDPTAPNIPNDAPQDVKDFFECSGDSLVWRPGEVTWLGLGVTPNVEFTQDAATGAITIKVSVMGGMVKFDLPASINDAGELVVDTSTVPDLSAFGIGGGADIDAAIKRINDWFKHNGKKLRPPTFRNGAVTLEKTPISPAPVRTQPVVAPLPVTPPPPRQEPVMPPPVTPAPPESAGGCGLLGILIVALVIGIIGLGFGVGYILFGGPGDVAQATATPSAAPSSTPAPSQSMPPTASPTAAPPTPSGAPSTGPSSTPAVEPTPTLAATPTATAGSAISSACVRVVHEAVGEFLSYLDFVVYVLFDANIDHLEVEVQGANDDEPAQLVFDTEKGAYYGLLGLHVAGDKKIVSVTMVLTDGTRIDVTNDLALAVGGKTLRVRYPQEDNFGDCPPG